MYRRTLALLWTGTIVFGIAAALDAFLDYMHNAQGILIGIFAMLFVGAIIRISAHELHEAALTNRRRSEQLQADVEEKTLQVRGDVDQLRSKIHDLDGKVGEARDWAEVAAMMEDAKKKPAPPEPDQEPCPVYQIRLRDGHREAIVGKRTPDRIDPASIWAVLEEGDAGTMPGTSAS